MEARTVQNKPYDEDLVTMNAFMNGIERRRQQRRETASPDVSP